MTHLHHELQHAKTTGDLRYSYSNDCNGQLQITFWQIRSQKKSLKNFLKSSCPSLRSPCINRLKNDCMKNYTSAEILDSETCKESKLFYVL